MTAEVTDLLVIGAGPAGLTVARDLARADRQVLVLDREPAAGGVPRHCQHTGFGTRDLHRLYSGPAYAARLAAAAAAAGATVRTGAMVTEWAGPAGVAVTSREGRSVIEARAVLLATGCRERPRPARLVPGSRPAGVFTSGAVQQFVHFRDERVGRRAVIVGAEHIAFSVLQTLASSGTQVAAVVTEWPAVQTFASLRLATAGLRRVPVLTGTRLSGIEGHRRVTAVTLTEVSSGATRRLACDTVVFTGDWVPDHELARLAGLEMDPATRGPVVDTALRTSRPGVFAAGNLIHPADPADLAAIRSRSASAAIERWLASGAWPADPGLVPGPGSGTPPGDAGLRLRAVPPLAWVVPQVVRPGDPPPRGGFTLRAAAPAGPGHLVVRQGSREVYRRWRPRLVPNRMITIPGTWIRRLRPSPAGIEVCYLPR